MNSDWIRHVQEHEAILSNEDIAEAYLVDKRIKRLEKYLDAGRRFETLPVEFLSAQWIDACRLVVAAPHKALGWALLMPLHCEFYLRGIEPQGAKSRRRRLSSTRASNCCDA